ncbi:hypothetical protein quinque_001036 [Culex quinquefasciatus]
MEVDWTRLPLLLPPLRRRRKRRWKRPTETVVKRKDNLIKVGQSGSNIDLEQSVQPEPSHFWQDLEHFIRNTHWAWLVVLASLLLLFAFLVAGFVLATVVLLVTFYLFICEQNHIESLEYS